MFDGAGNAEKMPRKIGHIACIVDQNWRTINQPQSTNEIRKHEEPLRSRTANPHRGYQLRFTLHFHCSESCGYNLHEFISNDSYRAGDSARLYDYYHQLHWSFTIMFCRGFTLHLHGNMEWANNTLGTSLFNRNKPNRLRVHRPARRTRNPNCTSFHNNRHFSHNRLSEEELARTGALGWIDIES